MKYVTRFLLFAVCARLHKPDLEAAIPNRNIQRWAHTPLVHHCVYVYHRGIYRSVNWWDFVCEAGKVHPFFLSIFFFFWYNKKTKNVLRCGFSFRRGTLLTNNVFSLVASLLMGLSSSAGSFELLIIGRLLIGINAGKYSILGKDSWNLE